MDDREFIPVVLCGGSGTRLWPLSRQQHPKQFLALMGDHSLFQDTVQRTQIIPGAGVPLVVGNESQRFLIRDQLEAIGILTADVLLEPIGRNTAPALALAAHCATTRNPDAVLLALPADHHVVDASCFGQAIQNGLPAARQGSIVVFGVAPTHAHTGYGYIRRDPQGDHRVLEFKEKPDAVSAAGYLRDGNYFWNSGMFLVRAAVYLEELKRHAPDIAQAVTQAAAASHTEGVFKRPDPNGFSACRSESIDYAVMEHTDKGVMVELGTGWSDLGSWNSLLDVAADPHNGNLVRGDVLLQDVSGSLVYSSGRLVAAVGLRDHVVVETPDAVLVAPVARAQEVKQLVDALRQTGRDVADAPARVYRPWGWYESLAKGERMQVKRIQVKPGASLSLQLHHHRAEHWVVVQGEAQVICGPDHLTLRENESTYIPANTQHRLHNPGSAPLEIIEVQSGEYLGEDDIVRFDDAYGRVAKP